MIAQLIIITLGFLATIILSFINGMLWEKRRRLDVNLKILQEIKKNLISNADFEKLDEVAKMKEVENMLKRTGMMELMDMQSEKLDLWK